MSVMLEAVRPIELSEILLAERIEHGETSPLIEQGLFAYSGHEPMGLIADRSRADDPTLIDGLYPAEYRRRK